MLFYSVSFSDFGISLIFTDYISLVVSVLVGIMLLKSTIAIRGMEKHAINVLESLENNNLNMARNHLSMIVKRNTTNLFNHPSKYHVRWSSYNSSHSSDF